MPDYNVVVAFDFYKRGRKALAPSPTVFEKKLKGLLQDLDDDLYSVLKLRFKTDTPPLIKLSDLKIKVLSNDGYDIVTQISFSTEDLDELPTEKEDKVKHLFNDLLFPNNSLFYESRRVHGDRADHFIPKEIAFLGRVVDVDLLDEIKQSQKSKGVKSLMSLAANQLSTTDITYLRKSGLNFGYARGTKRRRRRTKKRRPKKRTRGGRR